MIARRSQYLKELRMLDSVSALENSQEWLMFNEIHKLVSNDDLVETLISILALLEQNRHKETLPWALTAVLYLTGWISDECSLQRRRLVEMNPLDRDVQLALLLPGEEADGLFIDWPNLFETRSNAGFTCRDYTDRIKVIIDQLNIDVGINNKAVSVSRLAILSSAYSALISLIVSDMVV